MNSSTTIRRLPSWALVKRLRRAGLTQWDVAERAKCSQQLVSNVINRRVRGARASDKVEAVWRVIEATLAGESA